MVTYNYCSFNNNMPYLELYWHLMLCVCYLVIPNLMVLPM